MLPKKIVLLGASGQIGSALCTALGDNAIALTSNDIDLSKPDEIFLSLKKHNPSFIINSAACTSVDEIEEKEPSANIVNGESLKFLATFAKEKNIPLIHFSTDYVFSGEGTTPWKENDTPSPLNAYGRTKLLGEKYIENIGGKYLIFRTSWVYSEVGNNFVKTMLKFGKEREVISVVDDQIGSPSFATDLAQAVVKIIDASLEMDEFPSGIYHICNKGEVSWFEFAEKIFSCATKNNFPLEVMEILPIKTKDFPTAATRPLNSRLDTEKLYSTFNIELPSCDNAIKRCIDGIKKEVQE